MRAIPGVVKFLLVVAALSIMSIDVWLVLSRPANVLPVAPGRIVAGLFLQLISLGFFIAVRPKNGREIVRSPAYYYQVPYLVRIVIPFIVIASMGTGLFSNALNGG